MKRVVLSFGMAAMMLAGLMALVSAAALYLDGPGAAGSFLLSALVVFFCGGGLVLATAEPRRDLNKRESYMLLFLFWLGLPPFAALPFWLGPWSLDADLALFESVSALTTTGLTALGDIKTAPRSLLLWRALLQWAGGLMTVVLLVVLLVLVLVLLLMLLLMPMFLFCCFHLISVVSPRCGLCKTCDGIFLHL